MKARLVELMGSFADAYYAIEVSIGEDEVFVLKTSSHDYPSGYDQKGYKREDLDPKVKGYYEEIIRRINDGERTAK